MQVAAPKECRALITGRVEGVRQSGRILSTLANIYGDTDVSLTLAPTLVGISPPAGSLFQRMVNHLLMADVRHRESRRLEDLPDERLRDMGLTKPTNARLVRYREPWG